MELPAWWKVVAFTVCLLCGLVASQVFGATLGKHEYHDYVEIVMFLTMWALSYIMVHVGYEFTIDKNDLGEYAKDYLIAMTAAGFPWLFVAVWFLLTMTALPVDEAFLVARFAAPTSAGILFSMLEGAGLRDTWVFQKARILAIFDDLDTIILMIPLKMVMVGFKWELLVTVGIMIVLLTVAWVKLHSFRLPHSCWWTLFYGFVVAALCKALHYVTHHYIDMKPIHIEVLLPAFVLGCIIDTPCARAELAYQRKVSFQRKLSRSNTSLNLNAIELSGSDLPAQTKSGDLNASSNPGVIGHGPADQEACVQKNDKPAEAVIAEGSDEQPSTKIVCFDKAEAAASEQKMQLTPSEKSDLNGGLKRQITEGSKVTSKSDQFKRQITGSSAVSKKSSHLSRYGLEVSEEDHSHGSAIEQNVQVTVSMVFMILVGLSMPALIGKNASKSEGDMDAMEIAFHVFVVSVLMIIGKMFPIVCYRDEATVSTRLALCLGMCPRGEVGASIIVISLELGVSGPAVIISMLALVFNLVFSGAFIGMVKFLLRSSKPSSMQSDINGNEHSTNPMSPIKSYTDESNEEVSKGGNGEDESKYKVAEHSLTITYV